MKKSILIGSAALAIIGLFAISRNKKVKNKVSNASVGGLLTNSVLKMLHSAKRSALKEFHAKR